jgi:hypothetical protein
MFPFSWYFSYWNNDAPRHSGFKFQVLALSLLCEMTIVQLFLVFTGMTNHFIFHIRWICIFRLLYFNLFSASFCVIFLSDDIATSTGKQIWSVLFFNYYVWPISQNLSLCCVPLHSTALLYLHVHTLP